MTGCERQHRARRGVYKGKLKLRFMGCLVGTAIGDALGARQEGGGMSRSKDIVSLAEKLGQLIYTDDTHMTIGVAESLAENLATKI